MRPAATFVNYVYTIKITQKFRWLGVPRTDMFLLAALEPAHYNGCGPLP